MKWRLFAASALMKVEAAPPVAPVLRVGDRVQLRSGGPEMLVVDVDVDAAAVSVAWSDGQEATLPAICLRSL